MLVKDLIAKLQTLDLNATVGISNDCNGWVNGVERLMLSNNGHVCLKMTDETISTDENGEPDEVKIEPLP